MAVKTYHTDNGIFNSEDFMQELLNSYHKICFSGTGYPNQNVVAEGAINILENMERTMMLHIDLRCP